MKDTDAMNVLFGTDQQFLPHLATALFSLLHNNSNENIRVYVLHRDIGAHEWSKLTSLMHENESVELISVKVGDRDVAAFPTNGRLNESAYFRLLAQELLPVDKCLYLDSDLIVRGPIRPLYDTEIGDVHVAAAENPGFAGHEELGMPAGASYFNSGVMLCNLAMWRQNDLRGRAVRYAQEYRLRIRHADQDVLNGVLQGAYRRLDDRYNWRRWAAQSQHYGTTQEEPVIVHFVGAMKPWNLNSDHPYKQEYWRYRSATPFRRIVADDFSLLTVLKKIYRVSVKKFYSWIRKSEDLR